MAATWSPRAAACLWASAVSAPHADLSFCLQFGQRADRFSERNLRVGLVKLVQEDLFQAQPFQAGLAGLAQVLGSAVSIPAVRPGAHQPALGGDDQAVRVRVEGFGYQVLADCRAVGVGRVARRIQAVGRLPGRSRSSDYTLLC